MTPQEMLIGPKNLSMEDDDDQPTEIAWLPGAIIEEAEELFDQPTATYEVEGTARRASSGTSKTDSKPKTPTKRPEATKASALPPAAGRQSGNRVEAESGGRHGSERPRETRETIAPPAGVAETPVVAPLSHDLRGDEAFILAWGRSSAELVARSRQLLGSVALNIAFAAVIAFLVWRNEHKETYVFVRDHLGNIVQGNADGFLHAGSDRSEVEVKGFVRRWVLDSWAWTPLDVEDRLKDALTVVDGAAHGQVLDALAVGNRRSHVDVGTSGAVDADSIKVVLTSSDPIQLLVSFDAYSIDRAGLRSESVTQFVRVSLRRVPRSPRNPYGLLIVGAQISDRI
jgi:hypothetical protein